MVDSDDKIVAKLTARLSGKRTFLWNCPTHGETLHYSKGGLCKLCNSKPKSQRALARDAGHIRYIDDDGNTRSVASNLLIRGRPSGRPNPARVAARQSGKKSYLSHCLVHGPAAFHTLRGRCLQCFDTLGQPRSARGNPLGFYCTSTGEVKPCTS